VQYRIRIEADRGFLPVEVTEEFGGTEHVTSVRHEKRHGRWVPVGGRRDSVLKRGEETVNLGSVVVNSRFIEFVGSSDADALCAVSLPSHFTMGGERLFDRVYGTRSKTEVARSLAMRLNGETANRVDVKPSDLSRLWHVLQSSAGSLQQRAMYREFACGPFAAFALRYIQGEHTDFELLCEQFPRGMTLRQLSESAATTDTAWVWTSLRSEDLPRLEHPFVLFGYAEDGHFVPCRPADDETGRFYVADYPQAYSRMDSAPQWWDGTTMITQEDYAALKETIEARERADGLVRAAIAVVACVGLILLVWVIRRVVQK